MDQEENRNKISNLLVIIGLTIMLVMAVLPLLNINLMWMRWAFASGAAIVLLARIIGVYHGKSLRIKRLHHLLILSAILYCASGATMFYSRGTNDWIAFLLAGLIMQVYASWMIDQEENKTEK